MESGLYITFVDASEPRDRELPAVGPLDHVVLRDRRLLAERTSAWQAPDMSVAIDRLLEAELELQRATGEEPGGTKRPQMRFTAHDGVFLRFVVFGDAPEPHALPEFGPFAVVIVGPRSVEADGRQLATRSASEPARWELTASAGLNVTGVQWPDIAFRTATGAYHGSVAAAPPARALPHEPIVAPPPSAEPAFAPPPRGDSTFTPPPFVELPPREPTLLPPPGVEPLFMPPVASESLFRPPADPARTPPAPPAAEAAALATSDVELIERIDRERTEETLRARIQEKERQRQSLSDSSVDASTSWAMHYRPQRAKDEDNDDVVVSEDGGRIGGLLWRLRFVIIGILLVGAGIYGVTVFRETTEPSTAPQFTFVNVGARFTGTRWDWVINGTQRVPDSGKLKAHGVFYLVRIGTTNLGTEGAQLAPGDFTLIDANGVEHGSLGLASGAYQGPDNPGSPNLWPPVFRVGTNVTFNVLFDIDPTLGRGMVLAVADAPRTRVRLD